MARAKDDRKHALMLDAARDLFLARGYQGVTVDDIASAAGVSKMTVYSHFGEKDAILRAMVDRETTRIKGSADLDVDGPPADPRAGLVDVLTRLADFVQRDDTRGVCRLLIAGADQHPDLARAYLEAGPWAIRQHVSELIERIAARAAGAGPADARPDEGGPPEAGPNAAAVRKSTPPRVDSARLADYLLAMCARSRIEDLMGLARVPPGEEEVRRRVREAVDIVLRGAGIEPPSAPIDNRS